MPLTNKPTNYEWDSGGPTPALYMSTQKPLADRQREGANATIWSQTPTKKKKKKKKKTKTKKKKTIAGAWGACFLSVISVLSHQIAGKTRRAGIPCVNIYFNKVSDTRGVA